MMQREPARKRAGTSFGHPAPSAVRQVVASPGIPLSADARAFFEPRFGFDFSRVRIHADSVAAETARSMDAAAYAIGEHIAFDSGRYEMRSQRGRALIAHELAHTVQQSGSVQAGELRLGQASDASEQEAVRVSASVLSHRPVAIQARSSLRVQCQPKQSEPLELDPAANSSPLMASAIGSTTIDRFETGKSEIPATYKAELTRTAKNITSLLRQYPGSTIRIVGHADAIGKDADNQTLGQSRADSVKQALIAAGIPAEAMQAESHGSSDLRVKTKMENPLNRRVQVQFQPARQFPGVMSKHLSLSGEGDKDTGGGGATPNLLPSHICTTSPEICGAGDKAGPPYQHQGAPPGATQALPSDIPWDLMDSSCISDAYTSHGSRSQMDDTMRATWANSYLQYRKALPKERAAQLANLQVCKMAGQDQSRDSPNQQDQSDQEWKSLHPNDKGIPPISIPLKKF